MEHDGEDRSGSLSSVIGRRLAGDATDPLPTLHELGLEQARQAAFSWQSARAYADWHEMVMLLNSQGASEWVVEIHGILGVVGEQVLVAIEAEVEKEILRRHIAMLPENGHEAMEAALWRSLRFFAEGQGNTLIVAGHALANLTLRTMALHPHFTLADSEKRLAVSKALFVPRSLHRASWTSLTKETVKEMKDMAGRLGSPEIVSLVANLETVQADSRWVALQELRNEQYHRWRGESPGVAGVNFGDEPRFAKLLRGEAAGFGGATSSYVEGQRILDEIVSRSREALDSLSERMPLFLETWNEAFKAAAS